jgi:hypothetical protein
MALQDFEAQFQTMMDKATKDLSPSDLKELLQTIEDRLRDEKEYGNA